MTLKILTVNIWHDQQRWPERLRLLQRWIDRLEPDLIGFQEVLVGEGIDQVRELVAGHGFHADYGVAMTLPDRDQLQFGNAIASRWPILDREEIRLPDRDDWEKRAALSVMVDSPHGPIGFTCTTSTGNSITATSASGRSWRSPREFANDAPEAGFPPILVGDFNAEPDSDEIRYMKGLHTIDGRSVAFLDAWEVAGDHGLPDEAGRGVTWSNRNPYARLEYEPRRRIDYIFAGLPGRSGVGAIEACRVVCNEAEDGVWPSDHFGVFAELRTEPDTNAASGAAGGTN